MYHHKLETYVSEVVRSIRASVLKDNQKRETSLFEIDKITMQMSDRQFYCEAFNQMMYLI